ncbi:MAG TPA: aryl-sulfate sulfotransferase [Acidobacteriaceae bacterium]|nr:aryl-sulfate sulfotransferase [Acidobacteriaceae bacterium]
MSSFTPRTTSTSHSLHFNTARRLRLIPALCLPLLFVTGCGVTPGPGSDSSQSPPTQPPPVTSQSGLVTISPQYAAVLPSGTVQFTASVNASGSQPLEWLVNGVSGGNATIGTVSPSGIYTAPASIPLSENVTVTAALVASPTQNYATAVTSIINPGIVSTTQNPQVAEYSIYLPAPGQVAVDFGKSTSYGLNTWQVPTPSANGGQINILVAGMLAKSLYHMQGQIVLNDGATLADTDHTFTTGTPPGTATVNVTSTGTPQPGIEMWNTLIPTEPASAFATDLKGNVIWTYPAQGSTIDLLQGIQLLPNGDLLVLIAPLSSLKTTSTINSGTTIDAVREIDLAGNTVREITMDELNQSLAAEGYNLQLKSFHHNVLVLPNGHWVLMAAYPKTFTNLPGYPGATSVLGDVLVDVDQNNHPDWVWDSFDHLDVNRHPMNFPDWTHSNYMLYSKDDGNILLSMRHQNWIIKIDFENGQGSGNIIWRLGEGGDFKLEGGVDPTDWFYAQHGMGFFSPNTTGVFDLGLMDNGNDRTFPPPTGQVLCKPDAPTTVDCYSTMPILQIDESNMTATMLIHYVPPPSYFSFFGGNAQQLANGDIQVDFCSPLSGAIVQEFDPTGKNLVWQATTPMSDQFIVERLPSLYPGVQWP